LPDPDDSVVDYYAENRKRREGKFLVRSRVQYRDQRRDLERPAASDPGYVRMHTGVDWATAYGTHIFRLRQRRSRSRRLGGGYGKICSS